MKQILLISLGLALCACRSDRDRDDDFTYEETNAGRAQEASATGSFGRLDGYTAEDRDFLTHAAQGGLLEVESSRIALTRSTSEGVREFANKMIADHGRVGEELAALVLREGGMLPDRLDSEHQAELQRLQDLDGAELELAYLELQKRAHDDAIHLFERVAREARDEDLRAFASRTLPTLRQHRQHLDEMN